jgi:hypothetical protein
MEDNAADAIHAHPLLPSILASLVRDRQFADIEADDYPAFETQHHGQTLGWQATAENNVCAQLSLWSNTVDNSWVMYADLLLDPRIPAAPLTLKLEFIPTPTRHTNRPTHDYEGAVHTHADWERIQAELIEPWMQEGYRIEEEEEHEVSDEDTDCDSD